MRGSRGRAAEEEGRRRRRSLLVPRHRPARIRDEESEIERRGERGGGEKLDGEAEVGIYICLCRFGREAEEAGGKRKNPTRISRIGFR